jgi:hypothetical protein
LENKPSFNASPRLRRLPFGRQVKKLVWIVESGVEHLDNRINSFFRNRRRVLAILIGRRKPVGRTFSATPWQ